MCEMCKKLGNLHLVDFHLPTAKGQSRLTMLAESLALSDLNNWHLLDHILIWLKFATR